MIGHDETTTEPAASPETPLPVLLTTEERATLARVLEYVDRFDYAGFGAEARRLRGLLDDPDRIGDDVSYSYEVVGPWGVDSADDEAAAVAEVRKARAEHWSKGHGRDDRYQQIQARRLAYVSFSADHPLSGSYWQQDEGQVIEIPDTPLTPVEEAENQQRVTAGKARHEALYAHLREVTASRPDTGS